MAVGAVVLAAVSVGLSLIILIATLLTPEARGVDFRVFYTAGWAVRHGIDPYQAGTGVAVTAAGGWRPLGAFPYLPWVGWLMAPWSALPYTAALALWAAVSWSLVLGAARAWIRDLGWRNPWPVALLASVSTTAVLGYQVGQFDAMVMALLVVTTVAAGRGRWTVAGVASTVAALLKPQVALPLVPLLWALSVRDRGALRPVLAGQAIAATVLLGGPSILEPRWTGAWLQIAGHFAHAIGGGRRTLVGLPGLVHLLPASWHLGAGVASPATVGVVAAGLSAMALLVRHPVRPGDGGRMRAGDAGWSLLLPLGIWLLVSPYVHSYDMVVLLPLLILTLGLGGIELRQPLPMVLVSTLLLLPVVLPHIMVGGGTAAPLSSLTVLALVWYAVRRRGGTRPGQARALTPRAEGEPPEGG